MPNECKMRIKIADNPTYGIDTYGFFLAKSPNEVCFDPKDSNIVITDFPENDGDSFYVPSFVARKSFDYTISLIFFDNTLNSANKKISSFYNSLLGKQVVIYNDYKGVKVTGYIKSYKAGEFYRDEKDLVLFDLTFYIPRPQDCDFEYSQTPVFHGTPQHITKSVRDSSYVIIVPIGAESVTFSWDSSFGVPSSVIYAELGYEIKDVFIQSTTTKTLDDGSVVEYSVFTYTPAIPFSKQVTYIVK